MNQMRRWALVSVAGLALVLSGCSSSSSGTTSGSTGAAAPAADSTTAAAADGGSSSGTDDQLATKLCDALKQTTADMKDAPPEAAMAQISIALADVYGDDVAQMDATKIEEMTKKTCPAVHDEAVKVMKVNSLDDLS